ncbi:MAG: hypothetical protein R3277_10015 [Brumimicrobium sp.]|nr:hypothetical protein [Brumimicrobium sp.]
MFKAALFLFIFLSACFGMYGQLLDNSDGEAFSDRPYFNEDIVRQNKIKEISGDFTVKKVGDILRDTELMRSYHFNEKGQLIKTVETTQATIGFDTLVSYYEYNSQGKITALRTKDHYGFYATIYEYDSAGRVVREEFQRNLNKNASSTNLDLGKEFIVSFETSTYQEFDGQQKRTVYNSYGIPYKEIFTYYDDEGLKTQVVEKLIRTSGIKTTDYSYNAKGLIDSIKVVSNQAGNQERLEVFYYDDWGNLIREESFRNGVFITENRVLYDEKTMMINYIMTQEVATGYIMILALKNYEFFE